MIGIIFSFLAALCFGTATFGGGFATRRNHQFHVLVLTALSGFIVLGAAAWIWKENLPSISGILWSVLSGLAGTVGVASMYLALSIGNSATVAPTAAVIGTAMPVAFTFIVRGAPAPVQIGGFALALIGVWLVTRNPASGKGGDFRRGFLLACLAGISLGGFFICIAQVEPGKVFTPLLLARSVTFIAGLLLLFFYRLSFPVIRESTIGLSVGALDAGGDVLFMLAKQFIRLDIVVIICSLNSAIVVLLTWLFLKEKIGNWQKLGVVFCVLAIILISV